MGHLAQALAHSLEGGMASVETLLRRHIVSYFFLLTFRHTFLLS